MDHAKMPGTSNQCAQCGTPIENNALAGLCPACLLKEAAAATAGETATGRFSSFVPPSVTELVPKFPQLEIIELIGKGGMGAVYKARQKELDRIVALKILPPGIGQDAAFAERFQREARALAKLNHPGIVTIHDFGRADGLYYLLMEFVDGVNLRQLLNGGRISPREALAVVPQICDALQYAHDHGIVHRDIKPENILLDRRGRVKVADFGLAKLMDADANPEPVAGASGATGSPILTEAGKVMGTPNYMAPEQIENPAEVDHRADIYALGVVFYQMLTGELPGKRIEPPSKKVQIDVRLDELVLRALEKDPLRRYEQASVLKTKVEDIASSAPEAASKNDLFEAAQSWLELTDGGKYRESWQQASAFFQAAITQDKWEAELRRVRLPLGKALSRKAVKVWFPHREGARAGARRTVRFQTVFSEFHSSVETLTLVLTAEGHWKATGYLIRPREFQSPLLFAGSVATASFQKAGLIAFDLLLAAFLLIMGWGAYRLGIFFNDLFFFLFVAAALRVAWTVVLAVFKSLEFGLLTRPQVKEMRKYWLQALNGWVFWLLCLWVLELCLVPAQFTPSDYSGMHICFWGAGVVLIIFELLPGRGIALARNIAFAIGSLFMATQIAKIYMPLAKGEGVVLAAPFRGEWLVVHGGRSRLINEHQGFDNQRDALDIEELANGQERSVPPNKLVSYPSWGKTLYAPADGTVTEVVKDLDDNRIGQTDVEHPAGNHVVIKIAENRFVLMAHLKKGSVKVAVGDVVHVGQPISKCGNSGNTSQPHLHIQAQDKPTFSESSVTTYPILFRDVKYMRSGKLRTDGPFAARRNDWIIAEQVRAAEISTNNAVTSEGSSSAFHVGRLYSADGDSIELTSVEQTPDKMVVKGHYKLVSRDEALLALNITSTNRASEDPKQKMRIQKGEANFELSRSHNIVPGMPHVAMYANGTNFCDIYFGTEKEVEQAEKMRVASNGPIYGQRLTAVISRTNNPSPQDSWTPVAVPGETINPSKIYYEAKDLAQEGKYEEALQRYVWYLNHALEYSPSMLGVRLSFVLSDWIELGRKYPKARETLIQIRDHEASQLLQGHGDFQTFQDVAAINQYLDQEDETAQLFKSLREKDRSLAARCYILAADSLVANGEYDLCFENIKDTDKVYKRIEDSWRMLKSFEQKHAEQARKMQKENPSLPTVNFPATADSRFVTEVCQLVEILVATNHKAEAENIRDRALVNVVDLRIQSSVADAEAKIKAKKP